MTQTSCVKSEVVLGSRSWMDVLLLSCSSTVVFVDAVLVTVFRTTVDTVSCGVHGLRVPHHLNTYWSGDGPSFLECRKTSGASELRCRCPAPRLRPPPPPPSPHHPLPRVINKPLEVSVGVSPHDPQTSLPRNHPVVSEWRTPVDASCDLWALRHISDVTVGGLR